MANLQLPSPSAQQSDVIAALLASALANPIVPPVVTVTPTGGSATTQTYVVVAKTNGGVAPSAATSTTVGAATLSATAFNTISWTAPQNQGAQTPVTYDVYRTVGGAAQGLIASNLTATSLVDNGLVANTAPTTPPFNTTQLQVVAVQEPVTAAAVSGAVTAPGLVMITDASAAALTMAAPIAGAPSAGGQDGMTISFISTTAAAHTVTTPANKINGSLHIATFAAAIGNAITFRAFNGIWYSTTNVGVTLS
jgi:hypothetical protein